MKYVTPTSVSGTLSNATMVPGMFYAFPLVIRDGTYTFTTAAMLYNFGNVRLGIYSDSSDFPGSLLVDCGTAVSSSTISPDSGLFPSTVNYYNLPATLRSGKYWVVAVSDSASTCASFLTSDGNTLLAQEMQGQGWDMMTQQAIVGVSVQQAYPAVSFPFAFPSSNFSTVENQQFVPFVALGVQTFTPTFTNLPVYANNAAAVGGGLTPGELYRTGSDPDRVCVVH
jgi:hypothetical protein